MKSDKLWKTTLAGLPSDLEIVDEVRSKCDIQKFELLMRRYNQRLYRIARGLGIPDAACEDILQDCYIQAYQNLNSFAGKAKFSTWLSRILINNCHMYHRKKNRFKKLLEFFRQKNDAPSPESILIQAEIKNQLEKAILKLPEKYKAVFMLRLVEGMASKEVAQLLNITEGNVKTRLHRARQLLSKQLKQNITMEEIFTFGNERCDKLVNNVMQYLFEFHQ